MVRMSIFAAAALAVTAVSACPDFVKTESGNTFCGAGQYYRKGACNSMNDGNWPPATFRLAMSHPWSGGGWDVGQWPKAAFDIVLAKVNADKTLLNSTQILADYKTVTRDGYYGPITQNSDDQCSGVQAIETVVTQFLEHDDINAVFGSGCSGSCMPGSQVAGASRTPYISWGCSSNQLSNKKDYPYFIRTEAPEAANVDLFLSVFKENGWKKCAVLNCDAAIYIDVGDYMVNGIGDVIAGGAVTTRTQFKQNSLTIASAKEMLEPIVESGTKIIITMMYRQDFNMIMAAAWEMGLLAAGYVIMSIWPVPGAAAELGSTSWDGFNGKYTKEQELEMSTGVFVWQNFMASSPELDAFKTEIEAMVGGTMMGWSPNAHDALFTLFHAAQNLIDNRVWPEKEQLREEWWCNTDYNGLIGRVRFNAKGDLDVKKELVQQMPDGTLKAAYTLDAGTVIVANHDWDIWRTKDGKPPKDTADFPLDSNGEQCSYEAKTGKVVIDYATKTVTPKCVGIVENKNLLADTSLVILGTILMALNFATAFFFFVWTLLRSKREL